MSARKIRSDLQKAVERREQLQSELGSVQIGGRSREDALAKIKAGFAQERARLLQSMAEELSGVPHRGVPEALRREAVPQVFIRQEFSPSKFLSEVTRRMHGEVQTGGALSVLGLLLSEAVETHICAALDTLPQAAFGSSQAERDTREARLQRELEAVEREIDQLERAWSAEVGDGVPCPV